MIEGEVRSTKDGGRASRKHQEWQQLWPRPRALPGASPRREQERQQAFMAWTGTEIRCSQEG
jgi:hypothetical protein